MMTKTLSSIDRETWHPLLELATREVFEMMVGSGVNRRDVAAAVPLDVTAMVGLAGQLCGLLVVCSSSEGATAIASKMLGLSMEEAHQSAQDALAEVCNMIAGNFKSKLTGTGNHCMLSVPTVITGADYEMHSLADGETIEQPFTCESHPLVVRLELHS